MDVVSVVLQLKMAFHLGITIDFIVTMIFQIKS